MQKKEEGENAALLGGKMSRASYIVILRTKSEFGISLEICPALTPGSN